MPKFDTGYEIIDVPFDKMEEFEELFPDAKQVYNTGKEEVSIPINKRKEFLKLFPKAQQVTTEAEKKSEVGFIGGLLEEPEKDIETRQKEYIEQERAGLIPEPITEKEIKFEEGQKEIARSLQEAKDIDLYTTLIDQQTKSINKDILDLETDILLKQSYDKGDYIPITKEDFSKIEDIKNRNVEEELSQKRKTKEILGMADQFIKTKDSDLLTAMGSKIDNDFITLGLSGIARDFDIVGIARKYSKDPSKVTDEEQQVMLAYGILNDVQQKLDTSSGYDIGVSVMESIPFIAQYIISGGFTAPAKTLGKKMIKSGVKKGYAKVIAGAASSILRTPAMAPMIAENVERRMTGDIDVKVEEGKPKAEVSKETQVEFGEALGKSAVQAWISVATEGLGEYAAPAKSYLLKNIGLSKLDDYLKVFSKTGAGKLMTKASLQNIPTEFGEEIAEKYANKVILNEGSWGFEKGELLNTLGTVAVIGSVPGIIGTTELASDKFKELKQKKTDAESKLLTKTRIDLDKIIEQDLPWEEINKQLDDYIGVRTDDFEGNDDIKKENVKKITDYIEAKLAVKTIDNINKIKEEPSHETKTRIGSQIQETEETTEPTRGYIQPRGVGSVNRAQEVREEKISENGRTGEKTLSKEDFLKDNGVESSINKGIFVYNNPAEPGVKIRVKADNIKDANEKAYNEYLKTQENASTEQKTEPISELEIRPRMGEETPLRQPYKKPTREKVKEEKVPVETLEKLPDNVIQTEAGAYELNEYQVKQRNEMREKYGKEKADDLIKMFVDINDLKKYNVTPSIETKERVYVGETSEIREGDGRQDAGQKETPGATTQELAKQLVTETKPEVKKEETISKETPEEITMDTFKKIALESETPKEFIEKTRAIKNVPKELSKEFYDKYGEEGALSPEKAASKYMEEVKQSEKELLNIKQKLNREIKKTRKEKLSEKEIEIKNRLAERLEKISGVKKVIGGQKPDNIKEVFGVINDLAELGLIKLEKGIDHVITELKKYIPNANYYRKDIEKNFYSEKEPKEVYDKVFKSIDKRKSEEKIFNEKNRRSGRKYFNKLIVDKSENFRKTLIDIDKESGQRAADYFNLQAGMSAKSKEDLISANKKVFGKFMNIMSDKEQDLLAEYIDKKRIIELDNLYDKRGEERLKHEGDISKEDAEVFIEGIENNNPDILGKYGLEEVDINEFKKGAEEYYNILRNNLKRLNNEGIISDNVYKKLSEEQPYYSKRMYLNHVKNFDSDGSLSGIEELKTGSTESKVTDVQTLLGDNIMRNNRVIASNRARKAIIDFIRKNPDNGFLKEAEYSYSYLKKLAKEIEKPENERKFIKPSFEETPKGFVPVKYFENGAEKRFFMEESIFNEFKPSPDPEWLNMTKNILGWASGTKVLKAAATGYNPEFAVKNIPLDMLHIMTSTEAYSPTYVVATTQMINDIRKVAKDAMTRKGRYKDFIEQGGGMEYLTQQGSLTPRKFKQYNKFNQGVKVVGDVASYLGSTSEILTRLALRERYINNELSKLKKQNITPTKEQLKDIQYRGTAYARNYLDFSQGGYATKFLDSVIPYLNAGIQVTRGTLRAAKRNPKVFWYKMGQLGATSAVITAYNLGFYPGGDDDEKKERADYYKNQVSDRMKANNFIIMTNLNYMDKRGNKRYIYVRIPKDQTQQIITGLSEDVFTRYVTGDKEHQIMNNRRLMEFKALTKNVGDIATVPPSISTLIGYENNINLFYNEAIWYGVDFEKKESGGILFRGDLSQEYVVGRTPERFVKWGELTKMSPVRTRYAVQQFVTQNNVIGSMIGEGLDYVIAGKDEIKQELNKETAQKLKELPFARRFIGETNPYFKESPASKVEKDIAREKAKNDNELERLIQKESSPNEIARFIVSKEPVELERLLKKYIKDEELSDIDTRVKSLIYYSPEARARGFYELIKNKSSEEVTKFINDANRMGGIITKGRFIDELVRIELEEKGDINDIKKMDMNPSD